MALEQSIDALTASIDKLIAMGGVAGKAPAAGAKAPAKAAAAAKPKFTADQVKAKFQELRANEAIGAPPLKELITTLGHEDLAALLVSPASFDAAMEGLLAIEAGAGEPEVSAEDDL
jgi:hypothetical protein